MFLVQTLNPFFFSLSPSDRGAYQRGSSENELPPPPVSIAFLSGLLFTFGLVLCCASWCTEFYYKFTSLHGILWHHPISTTKSVHFFINFVEENLPLSVLHLCLIFQIFSGKTIFFVFILQVAYFILNPYSDIRYTSQAFTYMLLMKWFFYVRRKIRFTKAKFLYSAFYEKWKSWSDLHVERGLGSFHVICSSCVLKDADALLRLGCISVGKAVCGHAAWAELLM